MYLPRELVYILKGIWAVLLWLYFTISDVLRIPRFFYTLKFHRIVVVLFVLYMSRCFYDIFVYSASDLTANSTEYIVMVYMAPATSWYGLVQKSVHILFLFGLDYLKVLAGLWLLCLAPWLILGGFQMCCPCIGLPAAWIISPIFARISSALEYLSDDSESITKNARKVEPSRQQPRRRLKRVQTPRDVDEFVIPIRPEPAQSSS